VSKTPSLAPALTVLAGSLTAALFACGGGDGSTAGANASGGSTASSPGAGGGGGKASTSTSGPGGGTRGSGGAGGASTSSTTGSGGSGGRTYHTNFPLTENPISESGMWLNGGTTGIDWHDVSTTPGLAIGHQSLTSYTDGTAILTGTWGPTQTVTATVHTKNQKDSCYQEVEMRLRSAVSAHSCTGYEISFKASQTDAAYLIIVRWNGALGDFSYLTNVSGAEYGVKEGDVVKATIVGNLITAYKNGVEMGSAMDPADTFTTGNPGMGFNLETGDSSCLGTNGDYGFTDYTAESD
jgi:hypothetical protein